MRIESKSPGHVAVQCNAEECKNAMSFNVSVGLKNACKKFGWSMGNKPWLVFCPDHSTNPVLGVIPDKPYRIALAYVDNRESFRKAFAISLMKTMLRFQHFVQNMKDHEGIEYSLDLIPGEYGNVPEMRESVADAVIAGDYDAVMWMDSDMVFPEDVIERLLRQLNANEDADGVTGLYTYKKPPYMPHVYGRLDEKTGLFDINSSFPMDEPFFVAGAGFGCLLLRTEALKRVPKPRFRMEFDGTKLVAGEDLMFCRDAKTKLILDPSVSCGHLSETCIYIDQYLKYHGIDIVDGKIKVTEEQRDAIMIAMPHLAGVDEKDKG